MDKSRHLPVSQHRLEGFCRHYHVRKLSLFGSILTDRFDPDSDVDVLVEFEEGARVGFFTMARMERELSDLVGRKVDLRTPAELSPYFRDDVLARAEVQFAAG